MKNFSALFIVFLLSISSYTSLKTGAIDGVSTLGGFRSELIAMKTQVLQTDDGVKTIAQFSDRLVNMLRDLQSTQAKHEGVASRMFDQCRDEAKFRAEAIQEAQTSYNAASSALGKCKSSLQAAEENLPSLQKAHTEYTDLLAKKTAEREEQHTLYLQRAKDWKDAIEFLAEFSEQVKLKLSQGVSLADISEGLLKKASKMGFVAETIPILAQLAQAPSPVEEAASIPSAKNNYGYVSQTGTVNNLSEHLELLRNRLVADAKQNDVDEANAQKIFNELKARLTDIINKLVEDIKKTTEQIEKMQNCVTNETAVMDKANNKLERNTRLAESASATCKNFAADFIKATKNRMEEIQTLQEVITICEKRFGQLPRELVNRLETVKTEFTNYVNSTEFKKYVDYNQQQLALNVEGRALAEGREYQGREEEAKLLAKRNEERLEAEQKAKEEEIAKKKQDYLDSLTPEQKAELEAKKAVHAEAGALTGAAPRKAFFF